MNIKYILIILFLTMGKSAITMEERGKSHKRNDSDSSIYLFNDANDIDDEITTVGFTYNKRKKQKTHDAQEMQEDSLLVQLRQNAHLPLLLTLLKNYSMSRVQRKAYREKNKDLLAHNEITKLNLTDVDIEEVESMAWLSFQQIANLVGEKFPEFHNKEANRMLDLDEIRSILRKFKLI